MNPEVLSIITNLLSSLLYDGMKAGTTYLFPTVKSKITESRVKEAVKKAVISELENKVSKSNIFDCDAMQNYIEHMQPIQKIYQMVFSPKKIMDGSIEELLKALVADTIAYLKEKGKNINPFDESEIKECYSSIVKICDTMFGEIAV